MRTTIGIILKGYPRLSETFIARELRELERRGHRLEIFSMRGPREPLRQPVVSEIRAKVHYLRYLPELAWLSWGPLLAENAVALARFPKGYLAALADALGRGALGRLLEAGSLVARHGLGASSPVRHLHAHFIHSPAELAHYAAKIAGLTFSITAHAKDIYTSRPEELAERMKAARFTLTCTGFNLDYLKGIGGRNVFLAYHGVDLSAFLPGERGNLRRFVSVGRLVAKKGFDHGLRALAMLAERGEDFSWDLYGTGEREAELKALAQELGLAERVIFHGPASQPAIIARLREGGLFLCPSVEAEDGDRDGIPNTLLEAMAAGLPIVAADVSGIPEAVRDEEEGLLVPQRSARTLCDAIQSLLRDPERARRLGQAARRRAEKIFDERECLKACARHFESLEGAHEEDLVLLPALAGSGAHHS